MSARIQRDRVFALAKSDTSKALAAARSIAEPWYRAQSLAAVARFADKDAEKIATQAAKAAREGSDDYQKSAVRAWEIAALAERGFTAQANKSLREAITLSKKIEPVASRSEALFLLLQAAIRIGRSQAEEAYQAMKATCSADEHWRSKRVLRDAERVLAGTLPPRPFF